MSSWKVADAPSQVDKLAIVTGTGGLGYETALALASLGAEVIVAGRNEAKGREAMAKIALAKPGAKARFELLDLASLASVHAFAARITTAERAVDLLVNNAAVMALRERRVTSDGFEMQLGTNYLGHFVLTALLLPMLRGSERPTVVQVSSTAHKTGTIHLDDLNLKHGYTPWKAYSQSKLAMLMFALELQRQSDAHGWGLLSTAAHPGYARTDLIANGPGDKGFFAIMSKFLGRFLSHSAAEGALPTMMAAISIKAEPGGFYGPTGRFELVGPPGAARISKKAKDPTVARKLWEESSKLTGTTWPDN
jgi:NAD(P)-dependent dehydrogenase (short-subunit alcohol dehydrogenase family)